MSEPTPSYSNLFCLHKPGNPHTEKAFRVMPRCCRSGKPRALPGGCHTLLSQQTPHFLLCETEIIVSIWFGAK